MTSADTNRGAGGGHGEQSTTLGVGGATSGAEGATPSHETMRETGGSGGEQLTKPRREEDAPRSGSDEAADAQARPGADEAEGAGTAATAIGRGPQDTRSRQASPGTTGLGTPETGGNQKPEDLAPPGRH